MTRPQALMTGRTRRPPEGREAGHMRTRAGRSSQEWIRVLGLAKVTCPGPRCGDRHAGRASLRRVRRPATRRPPDLRVPRPDLADEVLVKAPVPLCRSGPPAGWADDAARHSLPTSSMGMSFGQRSVQKVCGIWRGLGVLNPWCAQTRHLPSQQRERVP